MALCGDQRDAALDAEQGLSCSVVVIACLGRAGGLLEKPTDPFLSCGVKYA